MNRRRQRPLRRRLKTQPSGSGQRQDSANALIKRAAPGALLALCAAIAIGFGLFHLFAARNTRPKKSGITQYRFGDDTISGAGRERDSDQSGVGEPGFSALRNDLGGRFRP